MSFICKLETIENKLESLSTFQKVELYLLPVLLSFFIFAFSSNSYESSKLNNLQNQIDTLYSKKLTRSYISFIEEYTSFINKNSIQLKTINKKNEQLTIKVQTDFYKLLKLLFYIESTNPFTSFSSYFIKKEKEQFEVLIHINFGNFFIKNRGFNIEKKLSFLKEKTLKVDSIIANYIALNGVWLGKGDLIGKKRVEKIEGSFIYFENKDKLKVVINEEIK